MRNEERRIVACRGEDEPIVERSGSLLGFSCDLEIYGRGAPHTMLRAGVNDESNAHRLELIEAVKAGKHLELAVKRARTYRQSKGSRNRRYLRFSVDQLETAARSWVGQPFLVDHNTHEQNARKGTILSSEAELDGRGMTSYFMGFVVTKADAVISVLDGTIDRFSVGWFSNGPVLCTVHGCDLLGKDSCYCWPGDQVEVDGKTQIVEYEYQQVEGKELSAVNVPAVRGTRIESIEYRAALAAELQLPTRTNREPIKMAGFPRLAAALKLTALTDEAHEGPAVTAVQGLSERALTAELRVRELEADNTRLTAERDDAQSRVKLAQQGAFDAEIEAAYKSGKLAYGKDADGKNTPDGLEEMLRDLGAAKGLDAMKAKLTGMRAVVPVAQRPVSESATQPPRLADYVEPAQNPHLAEVARQTGQKLEDLQNFARTRGTGL